MIRMGVSTNRRKWLSTDFEKFVADRLFLWRKQDEI